MTLFQAGPYRAVKLHEADLPELQRFFDANPEYWLAVSGEPPRPDEAAQEFAERPPPDLPYRAQWPIALRDETGEIAAFAIVCADLVLAGTWHLALFVLRTALHGSGAAATMLHALEDWARREGADYMRLGVVLGNGRAERFWERSGYLELRRRDGVPAGKRLNTVRVMLKPLAGATLQDYLTRVPRDRPGVQHA